MPRQCAVFDELSPEEKDLEGQRFGRWTVVEFSRFKDGGHGKFDKWIARCSCGTQREVDGNNLRNGRSTSCGCGRRNNR